MSHIHRKYTFVFFVIVAVIVTVYFFVLDGADNFVRNDGRENIVSKVPSSGISIPHFLKQEMETDWSKADLAVGKALPGGPGKDGIPAIDDPQFEPITAFARSADIQAIVLEDGGARKVYPYNILMWHEIVNDTASNQAISVTFCPLCGSAVVYERVLNGKETTFGVSGALLESNMIMYDRETESLWQQSTGKALAGAYYPGNLTRVPFQRMTVGEAREKYPNAEILSEKTGYIRSYGKNPYSGYNESDSFIFRPSHTDERYPSKEIFVIFTVGDISVAVPWLALENDTPYKTSVSDTGITLSKRGGELTVKNSRQEDIPFYFEMWFSWAVQHQEDGVVFDPSK